MADQQPYGTTPMNTNAGDTHAQDQVAQSTNGTQPFQPQRSTSLRNPTTPHTPRVPTGSNHRHLHSHSLSEVLRGITHASTRSRRQPSLTQAALQSLIDNPPVRNADNPAFAGRDWRQISIGELVTPDNLRFVELDTGIEEATQVGK